MKTRSLARTLLLVLAPSLYGQSGSINNTLGSGGTFTVKNVASNPLLVVDENGNTDINGQMTADRVKVNGVPSFMAAHVIETNLGTSNNLLAWNDSSGTGSHDNSGSFNPSTGEFVVPRNGFYFFSAGIELGTTGGSGATLYVLVNSGATGLSIRGITPDGGAHLSVSGVLKLNSNDVVRVRVTMTGSLNNSSAGMGYFSGYLVSDF